MQIFSPYDPKIWDVITLTEELRRAAQPLEHSFYHVKVRTKVEVPTLYTLKSLMREILQRGKPGQIEDMRAGLRAGLERLVRAARFDDAITIIASVRNQFPDSKSGLSDTTLEDCKKDLTLMKDALRRSMATYATKEKKPEGAFTFVNPKEAIKLTETYAKAAQGDDAQMAEFYRSLSVQNFTFCLMKIGPDEAAQRKFIYDGAKALHLSMGQILWNCTQVARIELEFSEEFFSHPGYGAARTDLERQTMSDVLLINFAAPEPKSSGSVEVSHSERIPGILKRFEASLIKAIGRSRGEIYGEWGNQRGMNYT